VRIFHVIPSLGGGGAERQLSLLTPALVAAGVDVHIAYQYDGAHRQRLEQEGAVLHPLTLRSHRDPRLPWRLHRAVRGTRPDIVQTWLPLMDVAGGLVALTLRIPWLFGERSVAAAYQPPSAGVRLRAILARHAAGVIANSAAGLEHWRHVLPSERRFVVPNALPFAEIAAAPALDRATLPLDPGPPLIVYAGRFAPEKNLGVLLAALTEIVTEGSAVALLCGDGPERRAAEAMAVRGRIVVTGYREDIWSVLKAASAVVSLSHFEGSPNVVLEAAACGTPLVLSDIAAHRALLGSGGACYVDRTDAAAVARALRAALSDREAAARTARQAYRQLGDREPGACASALLDACRTVLVEGVRSHA